MKLLFKQRFFSWFDSYDIYDENGNTVYSVEGQLAWGHCLKIFDTSGRELGMVKERIFTFLPKFEMYLYDDYIGCISKEFTLFKPAFNIDCNGWHVEGDFFEWDYRIIGSRGENIASVSKELFNWTDTYVIDINDPRDALCALMLVLAIDAEKCSRN
ncbi:MAG: LURP-one-related family protein [Oscillospiraceae bacterium]|nr:LURP-one-related family protein [Oscillospiraceae bacterium]MBQ2997539.1 LURP-one-related family protein [Oscillospiraceae bacterium]MBQ6802770.1 LURP-one-related family protein [Oscillospiraceae bacterium]